jgi:hypothetical protein
MQSNLYFLAAGLFCGLVLALILAILFGLQYALNHSDWPAAQRQKCFGFTTLAILGWLGLLAILANQGFFAQFQVVPPRFAVAVVPAFITVAVLANLKSVKYLLTLIPAAWPVYLQTFRVLMEIILWMLFMVAVIPKQMTFEGLNFDILVGLTAPPAGYYFLSRRISRGGGLLWNLAGLGLLLNIVVISVLSAPVPFRVFTNEPANTVVAYMPFIWLPGFVVPVALALHVFSIKQLFLLAEKKRSIATARLQEVGQ